MVIWMSLAVFVVFVYLMMGNLDTDAKRKQYLIYAGTAVALIMALRGDHGGRTYDFRVYVEAFELIARVPWDSIFKVTEFEQGFVVLCKLLSYIWDNGQILVMFQSVFCIFAVCRFIYKNTSHVFETFFFFVTLGTMGFMVSGIRQAIAISVILLSVDFIKSKKFIPFLIMVLLAFSIHKSAIVFIFTYFFINNSILQKNKYLSLLISVVMFFFADKLINMGASLVYEEEWTVSSTNFSMNGIINVVIYFLSAGYQFIRQGENTNLSKRVCFNMSLLGAAVYIMRYISITMERVALYFVIALLIGLSDFYTDIKKSRRGICLCAIIVMMCLLLYWRRMSGADYGNYVFFWE